MALIVTDALKFRESENDQFRRLSLSANFNTPVPVSQGGTGATTSDAARTNLGVPYISTIRQKITVPYTAESDGIVEINIRLDTAGRGYAIYSGSFEGFIDGYTVAQGYITGTRPVKRGSVINAPSSQFNLLSVDYYWTSFSN